MRDLVLGRDTEIRLKSGVEGGSVEGGIGSSEPSGFKAGEAAAADTMSAAIGEKKICVAGVQAGLAKKNMRGRGAG